MNVKRLALQRIQRLSNLAMKTLRENPKLAQRYIEIARRIAMRTRLHLPKEYRYFICRSCKRFILPGVNSRVRLQSRRDSHVAITCLICGSHMRIPLRKRKKDEASN